MEILQTYEYLKITYGELWNALVKFSFKKKLKDNYIVFAHDKADAIIVLSKKPNKTLVYPPHFASATYTLYLHGITKKKEDLPNLIIKERELKKKTQAAA